MSELPIPRQCTLIMASGEHEAEAHCSFPLMGTNQNDAVVAKKTFKYCPGLKNEQLLTALSQNSIKSNTNVVVNSDAVRPYSGSGFIDITEVQEFRLEIPLAKERYKVGSYSQLRPSKLNHRVVGFRSRTMAPASELKMIDMSCPSLTAGWLSKRDYSNLNANAKRKYLLEYTVVWQKVCLMPQKTHRREHNSYIPNKRVRKYDVLKLFIGETPSKLGPMLTQAVWLWYEAATAAYCGSVV
ncbi:hypothetical protein T265_01731 [Opisthorchis viverrini]|uniref:Uncharacterized protein n=1 Tax=Opisthorchis viverrini TaxID=6198 RepID=A0A075AIR8_OPIVI|nr:hypothetical protein T265_01731 [Opisthorchis viverrini]KER32109.1 hypothetical protein T265_01731 [Opisthorchis viverrini]